MIFFVTLQLGGQTGVFKSALDVLTALLEYGGPVTVVSGRGDRSDKIPASLNGYPTKKVDLVHLCTSGKLPDVWSSNPRKTFCGIIRLVESRVRGCILRRFTKPQMVLVNGLCSHDFWASSGLHVKGPRALIVRESPRHFLSSAASYSLDWALNAMSGYEHLIFVSSRCRDEWCVMEPLKNIPNDYVPNCCEEEIAQKLLAQERGAVRLSLQLPDDQFIVVCVGSLQPRKGQDLVIENLGEIAREIPNLLVCFVGADPLGWKATLATDLQNRDLESFVRFVPGQESALEWIYAADALLLPSRAEAMPRVVLEAMVLETPVVAAAVDGVGELIEHGRTGWLFSHRDQSSLLGALKAAYAAYPDPEIARSAARSYWVNFSREKLVERYCAVFEKLKTANDHTNGDCYEQ